MDPRRHQLGEAVYLFGIADPTVELHWSEFEALTTRAAPMPAFGGQELKGAYVQIGAELAVTAFAAFLIEFDKEGYVDTEWNIPLRDLVRNAGRGPDLGHGSIKLASRRQCSIPWHIHHLWTPSENDCAKVQRLVDRNKLGLVSRGQPPAEQWSEPPARQQRAPRMQKTLDRRMGRVERELGPSLSVEQLVTQHARKIKKVKEEHRKMMMAITKDYDEQTNRLKKEVAALRRQLADEIDRNRRLGDLLRNNYND